MAHPFQPQFLLTLIRSRCVILTTAHHRHLILVQHDDQLVKDYGVKLATNMIRKLVAGGIDGVNFCTLNLEKSVQLVLEELQWSVQHDDQHGNKLINVSTPHVT